MSKTTIYCPKCGKEWDWTISEDPHERAYFAECPECFPECGEAYDWRAYFAECPECPECSPGCLCDPECSPGCCELEDPMKAPRGIVTGLAMALAVWVVVIALAMWIW